MGLITYHFVCQNKMNQMRKGIFKWTSTQLRLWNELATLILFAIVFLAVLKSTLNWIFGVVGIVAFSIILMMAVKIYKRFREK
jgi:putative membrane protein